MNGINPRTVEKYITGFYDDMTPVQQRVATAVNERAKKLKRKRRLQNKYRLPR